MIPSPILHFLFFEAGKGNEKIDPGLFFLMKLEIGFYACIAIGVILAILDPF